MGVLIKELCHESILSASCFRGIAITITDIILLGLSVRWIYTFLRLTNWKFSFELVPIIATGLQAAVQIGIASISDSYILPYTSFTLITFTCLMLAFTLTKLFQDTEGPTTLSRSLDFLNKLQIVELIILFGLALAGLPRLNCKIGCFDFHWIIMSINNLIALTVSLCKVRLFQARIEAASNIQTNQEEYQILSAHKLLQLLTWPYTVTVILALSVNLFIWSPFDKQIYCIDDMHYAAGEPIGHLLLFLLDIVAVLPACVLLYAFYQSPENHELRKSLMAGSVVDDISFPKDGSPQKDTSA